MCVHVFGANSSMGCVNYALHQVAEDNETEFGTEAAETLRNDFYVDDLATSTKNEHDAIELVQNTIGLCKAGGFNLTKIMSTSAVVMDTIPIEKHSGSLKNYSLQSGSSLVERPLGVQWTIENDALGFNITFKTGMLTRRGILSAISGVYDPMGIASPFLLKGRKVLQEITGEKLGWDTEVSSKHTQEWSAWKEDLLLLQNLTFARCYKPAGFGEVVDVSLHTFGDGCNIGYGAACYIRQVDSNNNVAVSLVMGKARVSPLKMITIPRLELTAATIAVKLGVMVREELKIGALARSFYYTDNKVVLGYIYNDVKRFRVFVANRHQLIRSYSKKEEWSYIDTKRNPADDASRGLSMKQTDKVQRWLHGPEFLHGKEETWKSPIIDVSLQDEDPEITKTVNTCKINPDDILATLERRISRWGRMKRVMAFVHLFVRKLKEACRREKQFRRPISRKLNADELIKARSEIADSLTVEDLQRAELAIINLIQLRHFNNEIMVLKRVSAEKNAKPGATSKSLKNSLRRIYKLDPFIDNEGILRVGGRLNKSEECRELKYPVILPRKSIISRRVAEHYHSSTEHGGRTMTINEIRSNGYWIVGISGVVRSLIFHCVGCRALRGSLGCQKMADLPAERMSTEAPFTYCGLDMFGPFSVKEGRKIHKRYCALFTCLSSRAIHIEVSASMDTDSFIQSLRRFLARRGPARSIRSDNGGNFIGAENEMYKAWKEMDHSKIASHLQASNCDWIEWKRNVPTASHMGGIWERQIRTVRNVLNSLLISHHRPLDNESFCTLMTEVEAIVNSRPLTIENINDPHSMPLSPSHLLTLKSKVIMPPPGVFQENDVYCRKRWRVVQHLANTFWTRWRKEYLLVLQSRSKWTNEKRNFEVGDVVLLKDEDIGRNNWPMGVVSKTFPSDDGLVRSLEIRIATGAVFKRPISKIVLLIESKGTRDSDDETSRAEC